MRTTRILVLVPTLLAAPTFAQSYAPGAKPAVDDEPAYVEAPAPSRGGYGPRSNDRQGFFFRGTLGIGGGAIGNADADFSGPAGLSSFAIGGGVTPNTALGAEIFAVALSEPKLKMNGVEYTTKSGTAVSTAGVGLMATHFFMPSNVYMSGTVGLAKSTIESPNVPTAKTDVGLASNVKLGKEWFVSPDWSLGVAAQLAFASPSASNGKTVSTMAFGIAFTATYF